MEAQIRHSTRYHVPSERVNIPGVDLLKITQNHGYKRTLNKNAELRAYPFLDGHSNLRLHSHRDLTIGINTQVTRSTALQHCQEVTTVRYFYNLRNALKDNRFKQANTNTKPANTIHSYRHKIYDYINKQKLHSHQH